MIIDYRYIVSCTPSNGINNMNIIKTEIPFIVEAKTTDCNNRKNRNITYHFMESAHPTCLDKEELLQAQLKACQRLLRLPYEEENDKDIIENEIIELSQVLNVMRNYRRTSVMINRT
ncbi:hypothetical protein NMY3_02599 [Candidatus Nitrosocosmicus oleophilus]|uniref:Uncharacterized protein n=2 Tax=Candidatus Nitrosocosmicus oleophilus TaxID=1353260 RepID=A0A654M1G1_9ARCH|nr:hypothetical protein NMY3_02599 [Candidatus Nitrosocosmicus oleophilus]